MDACLNLKNESVLGRFAFFNIAKPPTSSRDGISTSERSIAQLGDGLKSPTGGCNWLLSASPPWEGARFNE